MLSPHVSVDSSSPFFSSAERQTELEPRQQRRTSIRSEEDERFGRILADVAYLSDTRLTVTPL